MIALLPLLSTTAVALATAGAVPHAAGDGASNALTVEPLAVVFARAITVEYERRLVPGLSLALAPSFTIGDVSTGGDTPKKGSYTSIGVTLAARIYPWTRTLAGFYVGPFGGLAWSTADVGGDAASGLGWSVGGLAGYTWVLGGYFDFSIGGGAAWYDLALDAGGTRTGKHGVYPTLRLAIGGMF